MTGLQVAPDLTLPLDAATETFGILAKKGAGKSNAAVVMAEEMHAAGIPWVAVDPKGDWWGLRASGDGQGPGLPIVVFGGRHGDVPLEPTAGALLADLVLEHGLTCVLDVSEFSKSDTRRFLLAFADRLYRQADADPIHLFLEEAHEYLPQMVRGDDANLVSAWQRIVKQGRFKGLGCTLVTQRSAALNKDVLTQVDTLIVLRTTSPQDRAAVKAWVDVHADAADMLATLPSLESGEAWVWSPEFLGQLLRIRFRRRRTFDSGATPKVGQKRKTPATLADVDLGAIERQMAATIEKAQADDPKQLRKRITELERALSAERAKPAPEPVVLRVEVPVLAPEIVDQIEAALSPAAALLGEAQETLLKHRMWAEEQLTTRPPQEEASTGQPTTRRSAPRAIQTSSSSGRAPDAGASAREKNPPAAQETRPAAAGGLGKTEHAILTVLAQHGPQSHASLALLAGYSPKASTISAAASKLRKVDYLHPGQPYEITDAGRVYMEGKYTPLPTGRDLLEFWRQRFGATERAVLDALLNGAGSLHEVCDVTGYSPTASTVSAAMSKLRKVGIAGRGYTLTDEFLQAVNA
jgi:hypothetical protein